MLKNLELNSLTPQILVGEQKVDVSNNSIKDLKGLESCSATLKWLNASHNCLTDISSLQDFTNLNVLNLSYNQLTSTTVVNTLTGLKALIVNNNLLKSFDVEGPLSQLNTLVVSNNKLSSLDLSCCPNLEKLSVSHNQLRELPNFQALKNIKDIKLNNNLVSSLPQWLPECKRIRVLDLGNNQFETVESIESLAKLPFLENLNLKGNPLCDIAQYYSKIKALLPQLKLLDYKNLSAMYLKELQNKTDVREKVCVENEAPLNRGFVSSKQMKASNEEDGLNKNDSAVEMKHERKSSKKRNFAEIGSRKTSKKKGREENKNIEVKKQNNSNDGSEESSNKTRKENQETNSRKDKHKTKKRKKEDKEISNKTVEKIVNEDGHSSGIVRKVLKIRKRSEGKITKRNTGVVSVKRVKRMRKLTSHLVGGYDEGGIGCGAGSTW